MLEEFTVDNFKSLINVTFRPQPENLLLGMNNAGKTNLCLALQFLAATASLPLKDCAQIVGGPYGIANFYFKKNTVDFRVKASVPYSDGQLRYEYNLTVALTQRTHPTPNLEVEAETLCVADPDGKDAPLVLLENTATGVQILDERNDTSGHRNYVKTTAPRDTTILQRVYDQNANHLSTHFKAYLGSWQYLLLSPAALRGVDHTPNQFFLYPDGRNLASVLYQLKTSNERVYRRVLSYLPRIDPKIDLINFSVGAPDKVFMFFEDKSGNAISAVNSSNGTLCFLALTYALVAQVPSPLSPLLIIEEPENGIYVGLLKDLLEMAEESPRRPQLIFTTHSPYFIDLFDNRLDGVFVMRGGPEHSSLTQPDSQQIKRRLEDFPLGEQHFREMLT